MEVVSWPKVQEVNRLWDNFVIENSIKSKRKN
jgi:hypothetical protein